MLCDGEEKSAQPHSPLTERCRDRVCVCVLQTLVSKRCESADQDVTRVLNCSHTHIHSLFLAIVIYSIHEKNWGESLL